MTVSIAIDDRQLRSRLRALAEAAGDGPAGQAIRRRVAEALLADMETL